MAGRKKNPINDIVDTAGAWLGGSRGAATNPQVRAAMDATRAVGKVVDQFATGGVGEALVSDAKRMAATGSSTPSALYKTAAVNLGAAAAGYGAAKVAEKVVESGVVARAVNKVTGEVVGLHGSPVKGLKQIEPRVGAYAPENAKPLAYAANPKFPQAIREVEDYAMGYSAPVRPTDRGSIYVTKAKKSAVVKPESGAPISSSPIFASQQPMKVVAEVSMYDLNRNQNLTKILKRAGAKVPKKK